MSRIIYKIRDKKRINISKINGSYVYEFIDSDTGVHYLLSSRGGMIPRLNSDGSIMCDK